MVCDLHARVHHRPDERMMAVTGPSRSHSPSGADATGEERQARRGEIRAGSISSRKAWRTPERGTGTHEHGDGHRQSVDAPGRRLLLSSALLFCCLSGGCAGLTPTGQNYPSLSGLFWNRSNKPAEAPGYDDYAAAAAASHPNLQQELAVSRRDNRQGAKDPLQNPSRVELLASSEENQDRGDAPSRRSRSGREADSERTVDSSIRVTLGRPESLQTVDDGPSGEEPALASAPLTNWKRSGASSSMPRQGADGDDPEAVEPARTAVRAPRDDRRVRSAENVERRDQNPPERLASGRQARPASRDEPCAPS